ncbi:MAG: hypothetical protein HOP29_11000 [Phycisphaerales bacterium]|nr:hypothetical protein [Phycisphaerales bacterium]
MTWNPNQNETHGGEEAGETCPTDAPLTESQRVELDRRIAEMDADPAAGIPWEVVKAELRKRS